VTRVTPAPDFETLKARNCCVFNLLPIGVRRIASGCTFWVLIWAILTVGSLCRQASLGNSISNMYVCYARQGPEGRPPNVSPAREGWDTNSHEPERCRRGTPGGVDWTGHSDPPPRRHDRVVAALYKPPGASSSASNDGICRERRNSFHEGKPQLKFCNPDRSVTIPR
jgi:hypothetical protein